MKRREFLRYSALAGASVAVSGLAGPLLARDNPLLTKDNWSAAYREGRRANAWAVGLRSMDSERLDAPLDVLHGRIPDGLRGAFYRNGPAKHELGDRRYHHWFDADGMIHAFRFSDRGLTHQGRYVQTEKHRAERFAEQNMSFLASHQWEPDMPMRALVVDKADWSRRRWFELPTGFLFHLGGGWDDGHTIHLDYERYADPGIVTDFARDIMRGRANTNPSAHATAVRLDMHGVPPYRRHWPNIASSRGCTRRGWAGAIATAIRSPPTIRSTIRSRTRYGGWTWTAVANSATALRRPI